MTEIERLQALLNSNLRQTEELRRQVKVFSDARDKWMKAYDRLHSQLTDILTENKKLRIKLKLKS